MGPFEALIILAVVLLLFGPKNLPKLGRIFGQGIHKIRESVDDDEDDDGPTVHPPVSDNGRIEVSDSDIEVGDVRYKLVAKNPHACVWDESHSLN